MNVGVAVITHNRLDSLKRCIDSLHTTTNGGRQYSNLVVVSDGSTDGTSEWLEKLDGAVKINHERNRGYVTSFNDALRTLVSLGSDVLFLLNDDVLLRNTGWINLYISAIEKTGINHFNFMDGRNLIRRQEINGVSVTYHDWVRGLFEVATRKYVDEIGYYDIRFDGKGCMDTEWADRGNLKGLNGPVLEDLTRKWLYVAKYDFYHMGYAADVEESRNFIVDIHPYMGQEVSDTYFKTKGDGFKILQQIRREKGLIP